MSFELKNLRKEPKSTFFTKQDKGVSQYNNKVLPRFKRYMEVLQQAKAVCPKAGRDWDTLCSIERQAYDKTEITEKQIGLITNIFMRYYSA